MAASRARTIREPITMMAMMPPRLMCLPSRHQWPNFFFWQTGAASDLEMPMSWVEKSPPASAMASCQAQTASVMMGWHVAWHFWPTP